MHAIRKNIPFGLRLFIFVAVAALIIFSRRPDQFYSPYIWSEDGVLILPSYLRHGLLSIFYPVNGYFVLSSKVIFILSALISFPYYPELSCILAVAFMLGTVVAVAVSPTQLRWPWLCALLTLLLPTDPEVFAVGLYSFWWAGLLMLLALLWNMEGRKQGLRIAYILIGGLSSPIVIALAPLFWVRVLICRVLPTPRKKLETSAAALVSLIAFIQMAVLHYTIHPLQYVAFSETDFTPAFIEKFFGFFLVGFARNPSLTLLASIILLSVLLWGAFWAIRRKSFPFLLLIGALFLAALMSGARVHPRGIDPALAGPRYFFYPYTILMWSLVAMAAEGGKMSRVLAAILLGSALYGSQTVWSRSHDTLQWRPQIFACLSADAPRPIAAIEAVPLGGEIPSQVFVSNTSASRSAFIEKEGSAPYGASTYWEWRNKDGAIEAYLNLKLDPIQDEVAVPVLPGLSASKLSLELVSADTDEVLDRVAFTKFIIPAHGWKLILLRKRTDFQKTTASFLLKVRQEKNHPEDSLGIAVPRAVERLPVFAIAVHAAGSKHWTWETPLSHQDCKSLLHASLFQSFGGRF